MVLPRRTLALLGGFVAPVMLLLEWCRHVVPPQWSGIFQQAAACTLAVPISWTNHILFDDNDLGVSNGVSVEVGVS